MEKRKNSKKVIWLGYILLVLSLGPGIIFWMVNYMEGSRPIDIKEVDSQSVGWIKTENIEEHSSGEQIQEVK